MADNTRIPHPNTVAFACLEDSVAILIADVIHAIYSILNWRQSSKSFLIEILARLGEENKFECSHLNFAEVLFSSLEENVRRVKVLRWSQKLIEDLRDSSFMAVIIVPRRTGQSENGKYYGLPTLYKRGKFWKLFRAVQDAAIECDLLNLPLRNRRQKIRAIVELWLVKNGAKRIIRERKEKGERGERDAKAKELKPCKCGCASCALCLVRPVVNGEALAAAERRIDKASVVRRIADTFDQFLFECGQDWMNLGLTLGSFEAQLDKEREQTSNRLREAMVRANKSGLRLVGGQPK